MSDDASDALVPVFVCCVCCGREAIAAIEPGSLRLVDAPDGAQPVTPMRFSDVCGPCAAGLLTQRTRD